MISFWALGALINSAVTGVLGVIVYLKDRRDERNLSYGLFCLALSLWSLAYFLWQIAEDPESALFWARLLMVPATFIPICYLHHIYSLLGQTPKRRFRIRISYSFGIASAFLFFHPLIISSVSSKMVFRYWPDAGPLYLPLLVVWFSFVVLGIQSLVKGLFAQSVSLKKEQLRYVLIATVIGWSGGATNFPLWFNIPILPVGNILTSVYAGIVAYAIIKYRLMDIRLVVTNAGIFVTVYTLVLGIPIWVGFKTMGSGPWVLPVALMALLATGGPFFYLWIQRRAEARLLAEQRKYQSTLRQASAGMGRIRDLKRLLNLIVSILTRVVRIDHAFIYLLDKRTKTYRIAASRRMSIKDFIQNELSIENPIVKHFQAIDFPLVYEEIRQQIERDREDVLKPIGKVLEELKAELVFPVFIRSELIAIVVMGKKSNRRGYSEDDLAVFSILSNQASLAIENAQSYEEMKRTQEQLFKADKMATIGTMADGLSHQINNRLHALGFIASDMLDTLKLKKSLFETPELKGIADEFEYSLSRLQENVHHGGEIVRGLMKYTRKGEEGFAPCSIDDIIRTAFEMAQFKIRSAEFKIVKEYDPQTIPKVNGNFTQLQEVFFNLIDNAYDATVQRKADLKEEGYAGAIRVAAKEADGVLEIIFSDNGIGVKATDKEKLFTPFFTTKATSKKGTGLGLYVIRKIIEDNHGGKVEMHSAYGQGTEMVLKLAVNSEQGLV